MRAPMPSSFQVSLIFISVQSFIVAKKIIMVNDLLAFSLLMSNSSHLFLWIGCVFFQATSTPVYDPISLEISVFNSKFVCMNPRAENNFGLVLFSKKNNVSFALGKVNFKVKGLATHSLEHQKCHIWLLWHRQNSDLLNRLLGTFMCNLTFRLCLLERHAY